SNAFNPTGSITFTLYAPADTGCTTSIFTSVKGVTANGPYTSTSYTTTQAGTFHWIATYSGDLNNAKVATLCTDEPLVVTTVTPTIVTKASPSVAVGGQVTDTATLSNGVNPTGSITFKLYGPTDANCTAAAVFTSAPTTVAGNGSYTSAPPFTPTTPGTYHWIATYSGDATNASVASGCLDIGESVIVTKIVTTASPSVPAGNGIFDTATLSGGVNPTGSILFKLYGPADTNCTAAPIFTSTKTVTANGNYQSDPFGANVAGTYRWIASYSGDTNNAAATTACNDAGESVVVTPVTPSIVTNASPASPAGTPISDTATLSGGVNPTGSITFKLYMGANCAGTVLSMSSRTVTANGNYTSDPFTTTAAGTYHWVASYSGDATNAAVTTACLDTGENVVVGPATPAITTQASAPTTVGGTISDTASLTGGVSPIGNIVFKVYLNDATCTTPTVFSSTVPVNGDNTYPSGPFTVTTPGTYRFVATFTPTNGNNATVSTSCTDPAEGVVVGPAATTLVTKVSGPVPVGGTITDTATLSGGVAPVGGSITFNFFGPDNNTCAGIPIFMSTKTVTGNGNVTSDPFTVPAAGAYRVVASYTGDGRNAPAGPTFCQDVAEVSAGTKASPAIVTAVSANTTINGSISDTATLSLGFNPTGSITFKMYGPNPANCNGTPVFMSTKTVNGNGNYVSDAFAPPAVGSYTFVATYTGDGNNNPAGPTVCNDPTETAQVLPAVIGIVTTASGAGSVTVSQPVTDTATISGGVPPFGGTLTFRLYNNNTCTGTPLSMSTRIVTADGNYTSDPFVTAAAGTYHWTATYSGDASNGAAGPTLCTDPAETVQVLPLPQISVTKVANPLTRPEPGGSFTFTVQVSNPSTVEAVKITSLFDNIYGDLSTRPGSTCGTLIGVTLAPSPGPGNVSAPCTFTGPFTGRGGDSQTDTVTVTGVDIHGVVVTATAQATVSLTTIAPSISVTKVANPLSLPAPGGNFTFTVTVTNTNLVDPLTITALVDNIYGNLATRAGSSCGLLIGTVLAPGATSPPCSFTGPFTGVSGASQTDTVTATGVDSHGTTVTATAQATVILTPGVLPQIRVTKAANPLSLPEPGGTFTFTAQVSNPSTVDPVKITSLIDNIYGNLATRAGSTCGALIGVTLAPAPAPGATSAPCTFTGPFTGVSGASQTDTITVTGVDSNGNTVTATAQATVTLTPPILPQIKVTKAANPVSLPAPGGTFTFTVRVSNPSAV
ncbi:MAG: hypothetical protein M3N98_08690, partial [Actinomycetota bacterium]|nr:hypothetical protein [Actinomycetota bacterium]